MNGLLITITGDGKGKTTGALGTVLRALGRGWKVTIIQFAKDEGETGEKRFFEKFPGLAVMEQFGEGFSWLDKDHTAAAKTGWTRAKEWLSGKEKCDLLVLDELNIALDCGWLDVKTVLNDLAARKDNLNVIVTGRNAPEELIRISDLVSEIKNVKHPFDSGNPARPGIDF